MMGVYVITLSPTISGNFSMTLTIIGQIFNGFVPSLSVIPNSINNIVLCN